MNKDTLKLPTKVASPVKCLSQIFPSEEERFAKHLIQLLKGRDATNARFVIESVSDMLEQTMA
jgi:hypothetical protein